MLQSESGSLGALAIRDFRILFLGTLAAFTAFFTSTVVLGVVAFELTGSNAAVGTAVFGQGLGMVLCGPLGGAFADRLPKRRVIAICQLIAATTFGTLGVLYALDRLVLGHLVANSFAFGCAFGFLGPARQALVVDLVPAERIGNAMALSNVANTISRVAGPVVAGVLLDWDAAGPAAAYAVMSLLYASSSVSLLWLPRSKVRPEASEKHVLHDLVDGLRYAWRAPRLRILLAFFVGVMLIGFPHVTLIPGLLENQLGRPSQDVTRYAFASAVGAFTTAITVARFADSPRATRIYSAMALAFGLALTALAAAPTFGAGIAAMVLVGASSGGFHALNGAVVARETEPAYMGRVLSLTFLAFAAFSLSALPLGLLADAYGERRVLCGMGIAVFAVAGWMGFRLDRAPSLRVAR
ncbi:MFS transporter [Myxococcota bacterium]|nr:MFS transporter [Myxococcota bacterium]